MSLPLQTVILQNLIRDEKYCRKTIPHLKSEYFEGAHRNVYELLLDFIIKYNKVPNKTALSIEFTNSAYSTRTDRQETSELIRSVEDESEKIDQEWLLDKTEKWCKDRAVYLAIMESINIIDGKHKDKNEGAIPELLTKALSVSFDTNVGHDYIGNADTRFDFYHLKEDRFPFDLSKFNDITKGGVPKKTLNVILAGTGVGKSLAMCHFGAAYLAQGKNVLYITLEMAEERIAERIDANLFDVPIDQLAVLPKDTFDKKVQKISEKTKGKLIIKEYPTATAHVGHFRALLNELKLKKNFIPDVIFVDYLNICASYRMKGLGGSINTYSFVKAIAEELRGLAVEFNVPIWTATQVNREGFGNTDIDLTNTSESFGLPATADLMIALISTENLEKANQLMVKQLKNRYNDPTKDKRFLIGVDRSKMRLYDVEDSAQTLSSEPETPKVESRRIGGPSSAQKFSGFSV